jgi:hypothetical protein
MARPSAFPRWATGGTAAIAAPSSPEQDVGHIPQTILTAQLANWLQNLVYQWLVYLDGATPTTTTAPSAVTATTVATIGTDAGAAHADHVHSLPTAAPSALTIGGTVVTGTSASLARADHVHAMPAAAAPVQITATAANSAGVATTFARSDHTHDVSTAAPSALTIGGTVVTGTSASLARADHIHAMPAAAVASALAIGGASSAGSASTFARSDHVHALTSFGISAGQICEGNDPRIAVLPSTNGFRLAPTVDDAIPADGSAFTTVYLAPITSDQIAIYNGSSWVVRSASGVSYVLAGRTTDLPFDIFAFWTGAVVSLEVLNWTSGTARATAIARQNGVWTKSGDATRRYLGTVRPRSATTFAIRRTPNWSTGTAAIDIWNVDNRKQTNAVIQSPGSDWTYSTATYRQANATAAAQIDTIAGLAGDCASLVLLATVSSTGVGAGDKAGIAISGPLTSSQTYLRVFATVNATVGTVQLTAFSHDQVPLGIGAFKWLEKGTGSGTNTWYGDTVTENQTGLAGVIWC